MEDFWACWRSDPPPPPCRQSCSWGWRSGVGWLRVEEPAYLRVVEGEEEDLRAFHRSDCRHHGEVHWERRVCGGGGDGDVIIKAETLKDVKNTCIFCILFAHRERAAWWARSAGSSCRSWRRGPSPPAPPGWCTGPTPATRPPCPPTAPGPSGRQWDGLQRHLRAIRHLHHLHLKTSEHLSEGSSHRGVQLASCCETTFNTRFLRSNRTLEDSGSLKSHTRGQRAFNILQIRKENEKRGFAQTIYRLVLNIRYKKSKSVI